MGPVLKQKKDPGPFSLCCRFSAAEKRAVVCREPTAAARFLLFSAEIKSVRVKAGPPESLAATQTNMRSCCQSLRDRSRLLHFRSHQLLPESNRLLDYSQETFHIFYHPTTIISSGQKGLKYNQ